MFGFGLLGKARMQMTVSSELRREHGVGFFEARRLASTVDDETLQMAVAMCSPEAQQAYRNFAEAASAGPVGAPGDFIKKLMEFFKSPLGQEILKMLMALLLGLV